MAGKPPPEVLTVSFRRMGGRNHLVSTP